MVVVVVHNPLVYKADTVDTVVVAAAVDGVADILQVDRPSLLLLILLKRKKNDDGDDYFG